MSDPDVPVDLLQAPRPARWLDWLSALFLCAGVAGVAAAAAPSVLRACGVAELAPPPMPLTPAWPPAAAPRGTTHAHDDHPQFLLDDEPRLTELERLYPDTPMPGRHAGRVEVPGPATSSQPGIARGPLTIREQADVLSPIRGRAPAGSLVTLLLEKGEWALIAHRTPDGATVGWTARSAIIVP